MRVHVRVYNIERRNKTALANFHCYFCSGMTADEEVARRLQAEYDREMAAYLLENPDDASMRRMMGQAFNNNSPQSSPSTAQPAAGGQGPQPRPAGGSIISGPSDRVRYPELGRLPSGICFGQSIEKLHGSNEASLQVANVNHSTSYLHLCLYSTGLTWLISRS